jgi:dienelactone hydrolase
MKRILSLAACICLTGSAVLRAQTLKVTPKRVLLDESPTIRATGLLPNERITIIAELVDGADHPWSSQAEFVADAQGTVDVSKQAPVKGSYKEASVTGLIWAMMPTEKDVPAYRSPKDLGPQVIHFQLLRDGKPAGQADLEQLKIADGVRQVEVKGQLHGVLFLPSTSGRHPGVLVLGGSEGGVPRQRAAWLASHGFAALALAYFNYEDLPPRLEAIPLEYFGRAIGWLMQRPEVTPDEIAVVGGSRGGELALQLGSMYPQIKAVVAYVPAYVRYPACCGGNSVSYAWTWNGKPLAYSFPRARMNRDTMKAIIEVEHTHGPILLISGEDDGVWESTLMAQAVVLRLKLEHFAYRVEHFNYPHAGHTAGNPEIRPAWHGHITHPISGREIDMGGTPAGNALSSIDAAPRVIEFLRQSLQSTDGTK